MFRAVNLGGGQPLCSTLDSSTSIRRSGWPWVGGLVVFWFVHLFQFQIDCLGLSSLLGCQFSNLKFRLPVGLCEHFLLVCQQESNGCVLGRFELLLGIVMFGYLEICGLVEVRQHQHIHHLEEWNWSRRWTETGDGQKQELEEEMN